MRAQAASRSRAMARLPVLDPVRPMRSQVPLMVVSSWMRLSSPQRGRRSQRRLGEDARSQ
jgi:hypothetical protein